VEPRRLSNEGDDEKEAIPAAHYGAIAGIIYDSGAPGVDLLSVGLCPGKTADPSLRSPRISLLNIEALAELQAPFSLKRVAHAHRVPRSVAEIRVGNDKKERVVVKDGVAKR